MALPDQLADLERKVSVRFSAALADLRQEMRRTVEAQAQRASSGRILRPLFDWPHDLRHIRRLVPGRPSTHQSHYRGSFP